MVIGPGQQPSTAEAEAFLAVWPEQLTRRLGWLRGEVGAAARLDGSTAALDALVVAVLGRLGHEAPVDDPPRWYGEALRGVGWSAYGAALVEGLMGYVTDLYAAELGGPVPWVLDRDPDSAFHLRPVVDAPGIAPPWRQVMGAVRLAQDGGDPARLRSTVEHSLAQHRRLTGAAEPPAAPSAAAWVVVTPAGRHRWQVSLPEDVAQRLGDAYAALEQRLAAVDGVVEAVMEDRDRALVRTRRGTGQVELTARLEEAVAGLARSAG